MILPVYIDIRDWWASLSVDFPNENIPLLYNIDKWKLFGNFLVQGGAFAENNSPKTNTYDDWRKWALDVYLSLEGNSEEI